MLEDLLGYATSTDPLNWSDHGIALDVGLPGDWDDEWLARPVVILDENIYKMWYSGYDEQMYEGPEGTFRGGYATAPNPESIWTIYESNPVLDIGAPGEWDDQWVRPSAVIKDGDTYKMWYSGFTRDFDPTPDPSVIPEPTTILLLASGLIGLMAFRRKVRMNRHERMI